MQYQPLNLYSNFAQAAAENPETKIFFDEPLAAFPELQLATTYQKSWTFVQKRAFQLASLGVKAADKIILFKSPKFDTYLLAVAASYLGAVPVMVSYHFPLETIRVFVDRLEDPYIIFDQKTTPVVKRLKNSSQDKQISLASLLQQTEKKVDQTFLAADQISYMTHTSGTTGIPKLICHSATSMGWRTLWQKILFAKMEKGLAAFHISPVHSRFNIGISSLMSMGFPMLPMSSARQDKVKEMMIKYRPLALETHPNNFVQWSFLANEQPEAFASVRYYHSTFDAINNKTMRIFLSASQQKDPVYLQVYGQSECGPMILKAHTLASLPTDNARDMGVGLKDLTQARIADDQGRLLPDNTDGNIQFLSKGRALTYYKEDARFQETVYGKWWDSGDYGMMDDAGHLYLKDRQVDLIKTINSNLAIEDLLLDQLDFLEEVVIVRDKDDAPQPILTIAPGFEMNWDAWWEQIADLPHMNYPIIKDFDQLPRTATMKVQRLQIEKEIKAGTFK